MQFLYVSQEMELYFINDFSDWYFQIFTCIAPCLLAEFAIYKIGAILFQAILTTSTNQDLLAFEGKREIQQNVDDSFSIRQKRSPKKSSDEEEVSFFGLTTR